MPWVSTMSSVIPTSVMPDSGDQFVRPIASDRMMPAIHIQSVPNSAIAMPRPRLISSTEVTAMMHSSSAAPPIAIYSSWIGSSSADSPAAMPAAFCIERIALMISGAASTTPMIAPPISMPMPSGRYSIRRSAFGASMTWPAASTGNAPVAASIGDRNQ